MSISKIVFSDPALLAELTRLIDQRSVSDLADAFLYGTAVTSTCAKATETPPLTAERLHEDLRKFVETHSPSPRPTFHTERMFKAEFSTPDTIEFPRPSKDWGKLVWMGMDLALPDSRTVIGLVGDEGVIDCPYSDFELMRPRRMSWAHWRKVWKERRARGLELVTRGDMRKKCAMCSAKVPPQPTGPVYCEMHTYP